MLDLLHKMLYTGIGLAALTEEKAREIAAELEKKGDVSKEEGKRLAQELIEKSRAQTEELRKNIEAEVDKVAQKIGWVRREDFEALQARVAKLEEQQQQPRQEQPTEQQG